MCHSSGSGWVAGPISYNCFAHVSRPASNPHAGPHYTTGTTVRVQGDSSQEEKGAPLPPAMAGAASDLPADGLSSPGSWILDPGK